MNKMFQNTGSFDRDLCGADWVDSNAIKTGIFKDSHGSISKEVCANARGDVCTMHTLPASGGFEPIASNRKLQMLPESQQKQIMTQREYLLAKYSFATKNELQDAIANYTKNNQNKRNNELAIGEWDVSEITDMKDLFKDNKDFNDDISKWQVGQVTDMTAMFKGAETFDQNLYEWDVSSVTDMTEMFSDAKEFRGGGLSTWKTGHVTSMKGMFAGAESFGLPSKIPLEQTEAMRAVMEVIRHKNEAAWIKFEQERPTLMKVEDLPWPAGPKGNHFAFSPMHDADPAWIKKLLRTLNLRWHPDRFQRYRNQWRGSKEGWDEVMLRVSRLSQDINEIKDLWNKFKEKQNS